MPAKTVKSFRRIQRTLDGDGIDTWFDRDELQTGDDWKEKIKAGIERASVFIPIISRSVLKTGAREFRFEWEVCTRHPQPAAA